MKYDYLIVGAGLAGSVLARRIASELDKKVLIIDKRNHIAGNCYDYHDENGILVHKYGPHIFHTNSAGVWKFLNKFTSFNGYNHKVLAVVEGRKIPVPFNLNSIYEVFPPKYAESLEKMLLQKFGYGKKIPILELKQNNDKDLKFLADYIYKNIFLGYTSKQWGLKPEELDFSVSSRVPVFISKDNRYFQDQYQGIPINGYTKMFENLLDNKNIHLMLNCEFEDIRDSVEFEKMIYTGPIDQYFNKIHGELPYRSLTFDLISEKAKQFQEVSQVNYPNNYDYTRITEFKHFLNQKSDFTTLAYEFPHQYIHGENDPYYPIPNDENHEMFKKYEIEAKKIEKTVIFVGRLAEYKYYNMDQVVSAAFNVFENKIAGAGGGTNK